MVKCLDPDTKWITPEVVRTTQGRVSIEMARVVTVHLRGRWLQRRM